MCLCLCVSLFVSSSLFVDNMFQEVLRFPIIPHKHSVSVTFLLIVLEEGDKLSLETVHKEVGCWNAAHLYFIQGMEK